MDVSLSRRQALAGLAASVVPLPAWSATPRTDPEWVRALLTTLHPGLYRYQTPAEFDGRYARFARAWQASPAIEQRTLALARLLGPIRCGHTHINPYNQTDATIARLTGGRALLPFRFRWLRQRMIVTGDLLGAGIQPGTEVLTIDGRPVATLLAALLPLARADGSNDDKRRALMGIAGRDQYEEFDLYQPLLWPLRRSVRLKLRYPAGKVETRTVATIDRTARLAARVKAPERDGTDPQWTIEQRGATAVLTMDNWALYDSRWNWRGWLDAQMTRIASNGTRGLVIDIRANEGGQDCGDIILSRLARLPLPAEPMQRLVRFQEVPADLRGPLDTWDKSFVSLGKGAPAAAGGYFRLAPADSGGSNVIAPLAPRFDGKVVVLISSTNSSATFQFAQRIKDAGLATLVGEPTGGNRRGINGGAYFFVRLPDSGLEFDLPLIGYFPEKPQPDAGIRPDVMVPVTASAIAEGRDEALEKALRIIA